MVDHDALIEMLTRLKLTAIRDQLDSPRQSDRRGAARLEQQQPARLRQAKPFLVLDRGHRDDRPEMTMEGHDAHASGTHREFSAHYSRTRYSAPTERNEQGQAPNLS
jgi:hypothetical protein